MYYFITTDSYNAAYNHASEVTACIPSRHNRKLVREFNADLTRGIKAYRIPVYSDIPIGQDVDWYRLAPSDFSHGRYFDTYQSVEIVHGISRVSDKSIWDSAGNRYSRRLMLAVLESA